MSARWQVPAALAAIGLLLIAALVLREHRAGTPDWASASPGLQAVLWPAPRPIDGFSLRSHDGQAFRPDNLHGDWNFVFFGYLSCPDVCPMTLYTMKLFREQLISKGSAADNYRFLFVSVDPGFDTLDRIGQYLAFYDSEFIGLGGDADEVDSLVRAMSVMVQHSVTASGTRLIDHTSSIMVIDPQGRAVASFSPPHDPLAMADRFAELRLHFRER